MDKLIGYDITDKNNHQPLFYDAWHDVIYCNAYDYLFTIGKGKDFETLHDFIEYAVSDGWLITYKRQETTQ